MSKKIGRFRKWLIHKLGGVTYDEYSDMKLEVIRTNKTIEKLKIKRRVDNIPFGIDEEIRNGIIDGIKGSMFYDLSEDVKKYMTFSYMPNAGFDELTAEIEVVSNERN